MRALRGVNATIIWVWGRFWSSAVYISWDQSSLQHAWEVLSFLPGALLSPDATQSKAPLTLWGSCECSLKKRLPTCVDMTAEVVRDEGRLLERSLRKF